MKHIEIIRESDDTLRRSVWNFWYFDNRHAIVLDGFRMESRTSRRQKFRTDCSYNRLNMRDSTINEAAVPMPEDVISEAIAKFTFDLRVTRWSDVK